MGDSANYVVVQDGRWDLYHSRWGALSLHLDLLAGPGAATRFIQRQRNAGSDGWLDDVWCEGAALVDHDEHRLCFFTSHHRGHDERAAILAVLARTWPGWRIDWAYDGLADLVTHLGLDPAIIRHEVVLDDPPEAADEGRERCLVSVVDDGEPRAYALDLQADVVIDFGPTVLGMLPRDALRTRCPSILDSGVHLDPATRSAGVWTVRSLVGALDRLGRFWPGWHWEMWDDRREEQLARTAGRVALPEPDLATALAVLREDYLRGTDPAATARALVARVEAADPTAITSPRLYDHTPARSPDAERSAVLAAITELGGACA